MNMTTGKRPDGDIFASGANEGEVLDFPSVTRGWAVTVDGKDAGGTKVTDPTNGIPPMEWFNALQKRTDEAILWLLQNAWPDWTEGTWPVKSVVVNDDIVYRAVKETTVEPVSSAGDWLALFPLVNLDERYLNADHFTDNYPVGAPIPWPNDTPPENYVLLQGQTFDITKYPKLAVAYSTGILPDLRGQTIKGKPEGREALSAEAGGVQSHTHTGAVGATDLGSPATDVFDYGNKGTDASGDHAHSWGGAMSKKGGSDQAVGSNLSADFGTTSAAGNHAHTVAIGAHQHTVTLGAHGHDLTIDPTGNAANTVDNIAFNYIVRLA